MIRRELMELLVEPGYDLYQLPGLDVHIDVVDDINRFIARVGWVREKLDALYDYVLSIPMPPSIRSVSMSPAYGRDVCYVGAYTFGEEFTRTFFDRFEREMKKLNGRPHWGKHPNLTREEARKLYPANDRFNEIRQELDPSGTFANEFI